MPSPDPRPATIPPPAFAPLEARSLKDEFVERFERLILSGSFSAGERLPAERDLAAALKVGRPAVHEGLLDLAAKGLVRIEPRRGAFVQDYRRAGSPAVLHSLVGFTGGTLSPRLFDSLLETRLLVETEAARRAASVRDSTVLEELRGVLAEEAALPAAADPAAVAEIDFRFHHLVTIASGNDVYPLLLNSLRKVYLSILEIFYRRDDVLPTVLRLHRELVAAIASGDPGPSAAAMRAILEFGESKLRAELVG